ncbi:MAG: hypothetical protein NC935_05705 [Candidatus Omnitrophica bacterium]|nr:hypothetical protein [Candidatus Omnitrophota bacterium]
MKTLLIVLIAYLSYLLLWFIVNLLAYYISIVFKKKAVLFFIFGLTSLIVIFLEWGTFGLLFLYALSLLFSGKFLAFIILFFFGIGLVQMGLNSIKMPFVFISYYFLTKLANFNLEEQIEKGEILDEKGKVIDVIEGETTISTRLAKYFLLFYGVNLLEIIIFPDARKGFLLGDFIVVPIFKIIGGTIIFGLLYSIYHKIKFHSFLPQDKRYFLINTWRLNLVFVGVTYGFVLLSNIF